MASLNTLRTRGGVIVSIVIGIALLSFVLGDVFSSGNSLFNSRKMKVGEIHGNSIGYMEYANEYDLYTTIIQSMYGRDALSADDQDQIRNMAWESLIMKYAYQPGFEKLGLTASETEQADMVSGAYLSPVISGTFVNPQTGVFDPAIMKNFVDQVPYDNTGRARLMWTYIKEQMNDQRVMSKFVTLVTKGMYVNELEVKSALATSNYSYSAQAVSRPYSDIADSTVTVSNSEIKDYYNKHKDQFKQAATRDIEYVLFDMYPSDEDYAEAKKYIDEIAEEFSVAENPLQYAALNSHTSQNTAYMSESQIEAPIAAVVFGKPDAMYGPVLNGETYTIARQADIKMIPDSLGAKHILLPANDITLADSLVRVIRGGSDFELLAIQYSTDESAQFNGGDLGVFPPERMVPQFSDACIEHRTGDVFTVESPFGLHVVQLTYKSAPVQKAQIAMIRYRVEPSSITQQGVYAEASRFMSQAAGSYDNFTKATNESAVSKRVARIRDTDRSVTGIDDSRELVRWAFNARKGEVSDILELGGDYLIATVTDVKEAGISPVDQVSSSIRAKLVLDKKMELLSADMVGNSIEEIATRLGKEPVELNGVQFGAFYVDGAGVEPRLIGAISSGVPEGRVSKPIKGGSGVFVYRITDKDETEDATLESERIRLEALATSYIAERAGQAMVEASDIKDNRVKFF